MLYTVCSQFYPGVSPGVTPVTPPAVLPCKVGASPAPPAVSLDIEDKRQKQRAVEHSLGPLLNNDYKSALDSQHR